jgi:hypothetical protein
MSEGPLGFPLTDKQAFAIEALLKALPREPAYAYRKTLIQKQPTEISDRSDVSWISTEDPDRANDVVIAKGMNDSQFRLNPIVTLNHSYAQPPVGKSLWRKYVKDGELRGIKAKTQYPPRPADWNPPGADRDWPADTAFALVQSGLLLGKSIGFLPTKIHLPTEKELGQPGWDKVNLVIDEWLLLEYACVYLPAQQNAVVESVSKSGIRGQESGTVRNSLAPDPRPLIPIPHTSLKAIEEAVLNRLPPLNRLAEIAAQRAQEQIELLQGRV